MRLLSLLLLVCSFLITEISFAKKSITYGSWQGKLQLTESVNLPFKMELKKGVEFPVIQIQNAKEKIDLIYTSKRKDTLVYDFPQFDSRLNIVFTSNKSFSGYWWNKNKKGMYTIPLSGHYCSNDLFECEKYITLENKFLPKKWKTNFAYNTDDNWPAIGLFEKSGEDVMGTFLTETGDYRFLGGNMFGDRMFLSCFDGSHAFLFTAEMKNDTLTGVFYSGSHYSCDWQAVPDDEYELPHPDELTYVVNDNPLTFSFKQTDGKEFAYPHEAYENKVTIIQIMGSWCPNCMDETKYYQDLYAKYHEKGLEIILIGYEAGSDFSDYTNKLVRFKERNDITFTMLVGGPASKNKAAEDFSMLNHIISFPTSIFVRRDGTIEKVHTGFNGPSTGEYYTEYMIETEKLIQELLAH